MARLSIGEFLAQKRQEKGYTQQQVANKLDVSNRTVSAWEKDKAVPDVLLLPAIAELYGVTVDEMLAGARKASKVEMPVLSTTAEKSILLKKLSRFTMQSYVMLGVSIVAQLFLFFGWYNYTFSNPTKGEFNWWLFMQYVSLAGVIAVFTVLIALWKTCESSVDSSLEESKSFYLSLFHRVAIHFYVAAGVCFALGMFLIVFTNRVFPLKAMCTTYLVAALVWVLLVTLLYYLKLKSLTEGASLIKQSSLAMLACSVASLLFSLCVFTALVASGTVDHNYSKIATPNYYLFLCGAFSFVLLLFGTLWFNGILATTSQEDKTVLIKRSAVMAICFYAAAGFYFVLAALTIYYYFVTDVSFIGIVMLLVFSATSVVLGVLLNRRHLLSWGGEDMCAHIKRNGKLYLKVTLWGLIPFCVGTIMFFLGFYYYKVHIPYPLDEIFLFGGMLIVPLTVLVCVALCFIKRKRISVKQ